MFQITETTEAALTAGTNDGLDARSRSALLAAVDELRRA